MHPKKALLPIYLTFFVTETDFKYFEFSNASSPIVFRLEEKVMLRIFEPLSPKTNAPSAITVVLFLTLTLFADDTPSQRYLPIYFAPE